MNPRQTRFVREYAADPNGRRAAINAGYAEKTAEQQASRLLRNVKVQKALNVLQTKTADKLELTHQFVLEGLMGIAADSKAVQSARVRAFELLGKHLQMFTDRLEITQVPNPALVEEWIEALTTDVTSNA